MTNLDSIFKSRDIILPTKVGLVKAMVFPVVCMDVFIPLLHASSPLSRINPELNFGDLCFLLRPEGPDPWQEF